MSENKFYLAGTFKGSNINNKNKKKYGKTEIFIQNSTQQIQLKRITKFVEITTMCKLFCSLELLKCLILTSKGRNVI